MAKPQAIEKEVEFLSQNPQYGLVVGYNEIIDSDNNVCYWDKNKNNIYDSSWTFSNGSATRSGNTAYGKGHYTKKVLFITTKNYDVDISVSCDKYGNIS